MVDPNLGITISGAGSLDGGVITPDVVNTDTLFAAHFNDESRNIIDMVQKGADPTGATSISTLLESYAADHTTLFFPEGTYSIGSMVRLGEGTPLENFHIVGHNATFQHHSTWNTPGDYGAIRLWATGNSSIRGIHWNRETAANPNDETTLIVATAMGNSHLLIKDMHVSGVSRCEGGNLILMGETRNSHITVEELFAPDGGELLDTNMLAGDNPNGVFVNAKHAGTIHFKRCYLEGFVDNGFYCSAPGPLNTIDGEGVPGYGGKVIFENCVSKNNGIDQYRFAQGEIRNCIAIIDEDYLLNETMSNGGSRAVWIKDGGNAGAIIDGLDVYLTNRQVGVQVSNDMNADVRLENINIHATSVTKDWNNDGQQTPRGPDKVFDIQDFGGRCTVENVHIFGDAGTSDQWSPIVIDNVDTTLTNIRHNLPDMGVCKIEPGITIRDSSFITKGSFNLTGLGGSPTGEMTRLENVTGSNTDLTDAEGVTDCGVFFNGTALVSADPSTVTFWTSNEDKLQDGDQFLDPATGSRWLYIHGTFHAV